MIRLFHPVAVRLSVMGLAALACLVAVGVSSAPADAQSNRELDARLRGAADAIRDQEARLQILERDRLTGDPIAERLIARLDAMEAQLASLTGALERSTLENQQLRARLATLIREIELRDQQIVENLGLPPSAYAPFDAESPFYQYDAVGTPAFAPDAGAGPNGPSARTPLASEAGPADFSAMAAPTGGASGFEAASGPDTPLAAPARSETSSAPRGPVTLPNSDEDAMQLGKNLVVEARYDEAAELFSLFLERYQDSPLVGEAWYWRGQVDSVRGIYDSAARAYIRSLDVDPRGPKAPEAMISLADALTELDLRDDACGQLDEFDRTFKRAPITLTNQAAKVRTAAGCP